jgi:uncharacterized protein YqhQ
MKNDSCSKRPDVGGQAVIEGVMIRGPEKMVTAVRKPDGSITIQKKPFVSISKRKKFFGLPVIRGGVALIESIALGVKALNFSASMAMEEGEQKNDNPEEMQEAGTDSNPEDSRREAKERSAKDKQGGWKSSLGIGLTMVVAFGFGLLLFFYLPLVLTDLVIGEERGGFAFNLVDGVIRVIFFFAYIWIISLWSEMKRIFQYHGAEHKTIFAHEAGEELTIESARKHTTRHPRCGTSFLLIVMVVSILVFMTTGRPDSIQERLLRFLLIPVIGGVSYEVLKFTGRRMDSRWVRLLAVPGLAVQSITTKEPDDEQLEVALVAVKECIADDEPVE